MHSSLPLLALSLLGALVLPATGLAQQSTETKRVEPDTIGTVADVFAVVSASPAATRVVSAEKAPTAPEPTPAPVIPAPAPTVAEPVVVVVKPAVKILAGNVVDEWGNPLMGATITIVGDKMQSVSTNSEGNYMLPTTAKAPVIQVSFAGYQDAERIARGPADLLFKLDPISDYKRDLKKRSKAATKAWKN
ncbi:carboxypeptidase regulatory-like domain-containing protein [Hymenobacter tenuis]